MSREIKFRAWNKKKGGWANKLTFVLDGMGNMFDHGGTPSRNGKYELSQYTGLKDKNGVEIYEGDIVNIEHPAWTERCEVIFDRGSFTLRQIRPDVEGKHTYVRMSAVELWPESDNWKLKVIGNIYETLNY